MSSSNIINPAFFIVGAAKAGTTSLYHYLNEHPAIFLPALKETNYFSSEEIDQQKLYYNAECIRNEKDYLALFGDEIRDSICGEASVSYLFYPHVPEKVYAFNPAAKIIILIRDPSERAHSHYLMDQRLGLVSETFDEVIHGDKDNNLFYQQYVGLGFYYDQIKRYIDRFGSDQVKIFTFDELKLNANSVIKELYSFIGVDDSFIPDSNVVHNESLTGKNKFIQGLYRVRFLRKLVKLLSPKWLISRLKKKAFSKQKNTSISHKSKSFLKKLYREDIIKLEKLIEKDLTDWYARKY